MPLCRKCGSEIKEQLKFCTDCGAPVGEVPEPEPDIVPESVTVISPTSDTEVPPAESIEDPPQQQADTETPLEKRPKIIMKPSKKVVIMTAAALIIIALAIVAVFGFAAGPKWFNASARNHDKAVNNFKAISKIIKPLQDKVSDKISKATKSLTETKAEDVADPNVLVQLRNEINTAKSFSVDIQSIASDTSEINKQVEDLTIQKNTLKKQYDSLNGAVSAIGKSKQKLIDDVAVAKEAKIQEMITPRNTYSVTVTDGDGNKEKITITIGSWIRGSETEILKKAWAKVDGDGSMPLTGSISVESAEVEFTPSASAYVFGTVTVDNVTPNFDAALFNRGNSEVHLSLKTPGAEFGAVAQAIQATSMKYRLLDSNAPFRLLMKGNIWGPVPFVIGAQTVFSPNYPDGNPELNKARFSLSGPPVLNAEGDTAFQIGKTW
jgi:hypothetical protein